MKQPAKRKFPVIFSVILVIAIALTTALYYFSSKNQDQSLSLLGVWQDSDVMGSGWSNRYHFFADGHFSFVTSTMDCSSRLRQIDGTWTLEKGQLKLNKQRVLTFEGGKLEPSIGSCGTPYELVDYEVKVTSYKEAFSSDIEQYGVSLTSYNDQELGQDRLKTDFGNTHYYKFYDDPTVDAPPRI